MRQILLFIVMTCFMVNVSWSQTFEPTCATSPTPFAASVNTSIPGSYIAGSGAFLNLEASGTGVHNLELDFMGFVGNVTVSFGDNCGALVELYNGAPGTALINLGCVSLTGGSQFLSVTTDAGETGTYTFTLSSGGSATGNDDCIGAVSLSSGSNTVDNLCSVDGSVWFSYTVSDGDVMNITASDGTLSGATIYSILDGCSGNDISGDYQCLNPNDVIIIEAGNTSPSYGDFTIDIMDNDNGIVNDDCADAVINPIGCGDNLFLMGDAAACPDSETSCPAELDAVWYQINVSNYLTELTLSGTDYEVFTGSCGSLVSEGCNIVSLSNTAGQSYLIAVEGNVDITTLSIQTNDDSGSAAPITTGGGSLSGSTICAEEDHNECGGSATDNDASTVWYSYTTSNNINEVYNLTLNVTAGNIPISDVSVVVFESDPSMLVTSDCSYTLNNDISLSCVQPNTTYLISVGSSVAGQGEFTLTVVENAIPLGNDLCTSAADLSSGSAASGSTICATPDHNVCGGSTTDSDASTVYYSFTTNNTSTSQVTINVSTVGSPTPVISNPSVVVFEDCSFEIYGDPDDPNASNCSYTLGGNITLDCVPPGTDLLIAVGSAEADQGNFEITLNENPSTVVNDACANATPINIMSDCVFQTENGNDTGACPENFMGSSCDFNTEGIVWYSVALPADAVGLGFQNLSNDLFLGVFNNDCNALSLDGTPTNCVTGNQDILGLSGNTTYLIGVGTSGGFGPFNFQIKTITAPLNDECNGPTFVAEDISTSAAGGVMGTNSCASPPDNAFCAINSTDAHAVYYEYTVQSMSSTNLTINISGTGGSAEANLISAAIWTDCNGTGFDDPPYNQTPSNGQNLCIAKNNDIEYSCVPPNTTLYIAVGSTDGNEGEFEITITEDNSTIAMHNGCDDPNTTAIDFDGTNDCEWIPVTINATGACPETFTLGGCDFTQGAFVWYEFTAPTGATHIDISNISAAMGNPLLSVIQQTTDCNSVTALSNGECLNMALPDGLMGNIIPVTAGTTYMIVVGTDAAAGSMVDFQIKAIVPPSNDLCDGTQPALSLGIPVSGTTECATGPITGTSCDADKTNTVWYTYTVGSTDKDLRIYIDNYTATATGASNDFSVAVFDNCPPSFSFVLDADGNNADYCGSGEPDEEIQLTCVEENTVLYIMVSSSSANEGTFDITIEAEPVTPGCVDNDLCDNIDTSLPNPIVTNDPEVCITDCNAGACPDDAINNLCGTTIYNAVFYQLTTDNFDPSIETFISANITPTGAEAITQPVIMVLEGDCTSGYQLLDGSSCSTSGGTGPQNNGWIDGSGNGIQPNTNYTIVIGTEGNSGGEFELCVRVYQGCVNDDPCDAVQLVPGVAVDNPATTVSCSQDLVLNDCPNNTLSSVWYSIEVPAGMNTMSINMTNVSINNPANTAIAVIQANDCNNAETNDIHYSNCVGVTNHSNIECVQPGFVYYIMVSSADDLDEGAFEIQVDFSKEGPDNDLCDTPDDLAVISDCEIHPYSGSLVDACPWVADTPDGSCEYSQHPTVFYEFTVPTGPPTVTGMDLEIQGLNDPMVSLLTDLDCDASSGSYGTIFTLASEGGQCMTDGSFEGQALMAGQTYYLLVGSSTDESTGFTMNIRWITPPINDDPCNTSTNPPLDITGSGGHSGTTCCARGPEDANVDGSPADFEDVDCNGANDENAVWYQYSPDPDIDGYEVTISGNVVAEVYWGAPDQGCNGGFSEAALSFCSLGGDTKKLSNCPPNPGDVIHIKVASTDAGCGPFSVSLSPASCNADTEDECVDAINIGQTQTAPCSQTPTPINVNGCLTYACPETITGDCIFGDQPTVWLQVDIDENAAQLVVQISDYAWDPVYAVFQGDCDGLEILNGGTLDAPATCGGGDNAAPATHSVPVDYDENQTYYIAISGNNIQPGDEIDFPITVFSTEGCVSCIGDFACGEQVATWRIEERSSDRELDDDEFCPGEEVTVCVEFFYDATSTGVDWLHGITPSFGDGWDMVASNVFGADGPANVQNMGDGTPVWFEADPACVQATENFPYAATYTDENGNLRVCNILCGNCPSGAEPLMADDPLPGGWYFLSPACGGSTDCPSSVFGIGSNTSSIDMCWDMVVRTDISDECTSEERNLNISIMTTSDGVTGCWDDPVAECLLDPMQIGPAWTIECVQIPRILADDVFLCSGGTLNLPFATDDGSSLDIEVQVRNNPNVDGEGLDEGGQYEKFPNVSIVTGGAGTITETLINTTTTEQEVIYRFRSIDPTIECESPWDSVTVTIYPDIEILPGDEEICFGACFEIVPQVTGGSGMGYTYSWSTGESTSTIEVCPSVQTSYEVTVTDDFGCMGTREYIITPREESILTLPETYSFCTDDSFDPSDPQYFVEVTVNTSYLFNYTWQATNGGFPDDGNDNSGLEYFPSGNNGQILLLDEQFSEAGTYELCVEGVDDLGCISTACMEVVVFEAVEVSGTFQSINCGDPKVNITVTNESAADGVIVNNWYLYTSDCDGNLGVLVEGPIFNASFATEYTWNDINTDDLGTCFIVVGDLGSAAEGECSEGRFEVEVTLASGVDIDTPDDEAICEGGDIDITVGNAGSFTSLDWVENSGGTSVGTGGTVNLSPTATTTYTITGTDNNGCTDQVTFTITVNPPPVINLPETVSFCAGSMGSASGPAGMDVYEWRVLGTAAIVGMDQTYTTTTAQVMELTIIDANGCENTDQVEFIIDNLIDLGTTTIDACDVVNEVLSIPSTYSNYQWSDTSGPISGETTETYTATSAGTYVVTFDDPSGCSGQATFVINLNTTPTLTLGQTISVCRADNGLGDTFVNFDDLVAGISGTWTQLDPIAFTGFDFSDKSNVSFIDVAAGSYRFEYTTDTATPPCSDVSDIVTIVVENCSCPSTALNDIGPFCNTDDMINLDNAKVTTADGTWSVISGPSGQDIATLVTGSTFDATGVIGGSYVMRYTLVPTPPGTCDPFGEMTLTIEEGPFANKLMDGIVCNNASAPDPSTVDLDDLIDATSGGTWSTTGTGTLDANNVFNGDGLIAGDIYTFTYTTPGTSVCDPVTVDVNITIRNCNCPLVSVDGNTICNGDGALDLTPFLTNDSGIQGTWSWTLPNGNPTAENPITGNSLDPVVITAGEYRLVYTLDMEPNPGNNCPTVYTGIWLVSNQPVAEAVDGPLPCNVDNDPDDGVTDTEIDLDDWLSSASSASGTWTQTSGPSITIGAGNVVDFDGQAIGEVFEFRYLVNATAPCNPVEVNITITVQSCDCPPISIGTLGNVCNDSGMVDLTGLSAQEADGTYRIEDAAGTPQTLSGNVLDATGLPAGVYTVYFTLNDTPAPSCTAELSTTFEIMNYGTATVTPSTDACNVVDDINGRHIVDLTMLVDNPLSGTWTDQDGTPVADPMNVDFSGTTVNDVFTFTFTIDNVDPCPDFMMDVEVTIVDCDCPSPGNPDPICNTENAFDLSAYNDPAYPGTWSTSETGLVITGGQFLDATGITTAGNYELTYDDPDDDCPASVRTINISVQMEAGMANGILELCEGDSVQVELSGLLDGQDLFGTWENVSMNTGEGTFDPAGTFNTYQAAVGTYEFRYSFDNQTPCADDESTVEIIIHQLPSADAGPDQELDCDVTQVELGGSSQPQGQISYKWREITGGSSIELGDSETLPVESSGDFELKVTLDAYNVCADRDSVSVTESADRPAVEVELQQPLCFGELGTLTIELVDCATGDCDVTLNGDVVNPGTFENLPAGDYIVGITDNGNGCNREYAPEVIVAQEEFMVDIPDPFIFGSLGDDFEITFTSNQPGNVGNITWTDSEGNLLCQGAPADCDTLLVTPTVDETYYVEVLNANGCPSMDSIQIRLEEIVDVEFPNILDQNASAGDNKNFFVQSENVENVKRLIVYDRWGEKVFDAENIPPNEPSLGWDGTFKGQQVVPGVYTFLAILEMKTSGGAPAGEITRAGDVTVTR